MAVATPFYLTTTGERGQPGRCRSIEIETPLNYLSIAGCPANTSEISDAVQVEYHSSLPVTSNFSVQKGKYFEVVE
jgi:hypothetical protein